MELNDLVLEFVEILERQESNEDGKMFHPTKITSCRTVDFARMTKLIPEMKRIALEGKRQWQD